VSEGLGAGADGDGGGESVVLDGLACGDEVAGLRAATLADW
jgi:hypothetical protein